MFVFGYILWHSLRLLPIAIVIAGALAAAAIYLYLPQVRSLGRPWRWVLPALRVAAVVALAASILKPVAIRPRDEQESGAVVVIVDRSRSMSIADAGRTPGQLVALADGLGKLPPNVRTAATVGVVDGVTKLRALADEAAGAYSELEYSKLTGRGSAEAEDRAKKAVEAYTAAAGKVVADAGALSKSAPPLVQQLAQLAVLPNPPSRDAWQGAMRAKIDAAAASLASSQSASDEELYKSNADVRKICDEIARRTRFDLVEQFLTDPTNGLLAKLPKKAPLYGFGAASDVTPIALRAGDGSAVRRLLVEPTGRTSDLTADTRAALDGLKGQSIQAVVLLSDGRQVGGDETVSSALSATGVPIFTVPAAGAVSRDVSVARVGLPPSAFVDETMTTRVDVRGVGMKGQTVDVNLTIGDAPKQTQKVTFATDDPVVPVTFETKLDKPGAKELNVDVTPVDGETTRDNNVAHRWVKVQADKIKVTLLAGAPGWDYQYLRNSLSRTPWVKVQDYILDSPDVKLKLEPDQLREQDVIVLCDVPVGSLSDAQWDAIHRTVTDRGGSVMLLAGNAHMPAEYTHHTLLSSFLPYRGDVSPTWRSWPGEEPFFHIVPAKGAEQIDALRLEQGTPAQEASRWSQLPAFYRYLPIGDLKPNTRPLLVERDTSAPVLTESRLGLGRVFFVGADETWRWRYKIGEKDQDRFWLQLIRYAAEEPYSVQNGTVSLDADRIAIEPHTSVRVRARVLDDNWLPSKSPTQELRIVQGSQNIRTQTMDSVGGGESGTGRYETTIGDLGEGEYKLQVINKDKPDSPACEMTLHVLSTDEAEMADLSGDEAMLRHLAEASGGELIPLAQLKDLPEKLAKIQDTRTRIAEQPLWDSYYLFLFVLACLGAEWALRKRHGLA